MKKKWIRIKAGVLIFYSKKRKQQNQLVDSSQKQIFFVFLKILNIEI